MPGPTTQLLHRIKDGDSSAKDALYGVLYGRLRDLAARQLRHESEALTLTPTALVHEAYLALVGHEDAWNDHVHVLAVAATAMRHILVDYARRKTALKRGSNAPHVSFDEQQERIGFGPGRALRVDEHAHALLDMDRVLIELAQRDARLGSVIECRVFGGLTTSETAAALGISTATVDRDWARARAYLRDALSDEC